MTLGEAVNLSLHVEGVITAEGHMAGQPELHLQIDSILGSAQQSFPLCTTHQSWLPPPRQAKSVLLLRCGPNGSAGTSHP